MKILFEQVRFLTSALEEWPVVKDPRGHLLPEVALVGRSNVGKSSLINALLRQRIARTSATPGKTQLANVYRVQRGAGAPFYVVDLPGYGYAAGRSRREDAPYQVLADSVFERQPAALLLVDARHPGLEP